MGLKVGMAWRGVRLRVFQVDAGGRVRGISGKFKLKDNPIELEVPWV